MTDPVDDLLDALQDAMTKVQGCPATKTQLKDALGYEHLSQLSRLRNPKNTGYRTPANIGELIDRVEDLIGDWERGRTSKSGRRSGTRMSRSRILATMRGTVVVRGRRLRVDLPSSVTERYPRGVDALPYRPEDLDAIETFLSLDRARTSDEWIAPIEQLRAAFNTRLRGKHDHPETRRLGRLVVRAAHRVNAYVPLAGTESSPRNVHRDLMTLTQEWIERVRKSAHDPQTIADAWRVLGFAAHASGDLSTALRRFKVGMRFLERQGQEGTAQDAHLRLAQVDALIRNGREPRPQPLRDHLDQILLGEADHVLSARVRALQLKAKVGLIAGRRGRRTDREESLKEAVRTLDKADRLQNTSELSYHGQFEHWLSRSAALAGLDRRGADEAMKKAEEIAVAGELGSQLRRIQLLRNPRLGRSQKPEWRGRDQTELKLEIAVWGMHRRGARY